MNCPKCQLIEMRVDKVEDNQMYYRCRKCGTEVIKTIEELEEENKDE